MLKPHRRVSCLSLFALGTALTITACSSNDPAGHASDSGVVDPPAPPTGLEITAASKASIGMSWTASSSVDVTSYTVERAPVGDATFAPVATDLATDMTSFEDTTVDQYVAYTYRVLAVNAAGASAPSNEDTAGPPPSRLQAATTLPTDQGTVSRFGIHTSLALDDNDDPIVAFVGEYDTLASGDTDRLYDVRWDRTNYQWAAPVQIDDLGDIASDAPARQVSLSRDRSNNQLAIAYQRGPSEAWLATSGDGGGSWTKERVDVDDGGYAGPISNPRVVLVGGVTHLTYYHGCIKHFTPLADCNSGNDSNAIVYLTRPGASAAFTSSISPVLAQTQDAYPINDLAVDSNGEPGVAYFLHPILGAAASYNTTLAFWRPGQAAVKVTDTHNVQNDTPSLSLAFDGTKPRVAYHLMQAVDQTHDVWFSSSPDTGATWNPPVAIPRETPLAVTSVFQSLALDSHGNAHVAANFSSGSGATSGGPKLFHADAPGYVTWSGGSPDASGLSEFAGDYVHTRYAGNDKISMVFYYGGASAGLGPAIVFWREP